MIWTAPEVLRNEPYCTASDVYSFAIVATELLTRKLPYAGRSLLTIPVAVTVHHLRPLLPSLPSPTDAAGTTEAATAEIEVAWRARFHSCVRACWHIDPAARPTFLQVIDVLNELVHEAQQQRQQ